MCIHAGGGYLSMSFDLFALRATGVIVLSVSDFLLFLICSI